MADREEDGGADVPLVLVEDDGAWLDPWKGSFCGGGGGAWEEEAEEERESGGAEGKEGGGPGKKGGLVLLLLRATGGGGGKSMVLLSGGTVFNIPLLTTQFLDKKRGTTDR